MKEGHMRKPSSVLTQRICIAAQRRANNNHSDRAIPIHQTMSSTYLIRLFKEIESIRANTAIDPARPRQVQTVRPDQTLRTRYNTPSTNPSDVLHHHLSSVTGGEEQSHGDGILTSHNAGGHHSLTPSMYEEGWVTDPYTQRRLHWVRDRYTQTPRYWILDADTPTPRSLIVDLHSQMPRNQLPSGHNELPKRSLHHGDIPFTDDLGGISGMSLQHGTLVSHFSPKTSGMQPRKESAAQIKPHVDVENSVLNLGYGNERLSPVNVACTFICRGSSPCIFQAQLKISLHHVRQH